MNRKYIGAIVMKIFLVVVAVVSAVVVIGHLGAPEATIAEHRNEKEWLFILLAGVAVLDLIFCIIFAISFHNKRNEEKTDDERAGVLLRVFAGVLLCVAVVLLLRNSFFFVHHFGEESFEYATLLGERESTAVNRYGYYLLSSIFAGATVVLVSVLDIISFLKWQKKVDKSGDGSLIDLRSPD